MRTLLDNNELIQSAYVNPEKNGINRNVIYLLATHGLSSIVRTFAKVFLAIYFLKFTQIGLSSVALFYGILYAVNAGVFLGVGTIVKCGARMLLFRLGIFFYAAFLLLLLILGKEAGEHIIALAVLFGAGEGLYWLPYNVLKFENSNAVNRRTIFGYEKGIEDSVKIAAPLLIGMVISAGSYKIVFLSAVAFVILAFLLSLKLYGKTNQDDGVHLKEFWGILEFNHDIIKAYWTEFLRGINYIGSLEIIVPIIIFLSFKSEVSLGMLTSVFAVISVLTSLLIAKYLKRHCFTSIIIASGLMLFFSSLLLVLQVNMLTVIAYNLLFALTVPTLNILQSVNSYDVIDREDLASFRVEHLIFREAFRNIGRLIGFLILFVVGVYGSDIKSVKVALVVLSFSVLLISLQARKSKD